MKVIYNRYLHKCPACKRKFRGLKKRIFCSKSCKGRLYKSRLGAKSSSKHKLRIRLSVIKWYKQFKVAGMWKQQLKEYWKVHRWVEEQLGKPRICEQCGSEGDSYHWANISKKYLRDVSDWKRLCPKCHRAMDFGKAAA